MLNDEKSGAPIQPEPRSKRPEHSITLAQTRTFGLALKDAEVLAQSEALSRELRALADRRAEPHLGDAERVQFYL